LGISEIEILDRLMTVSRQVIEQEQMGRRSLMKERPSQIEDMVFRAYGILTNARLLNSEETMFYLSCLRLGIDLGLLHNVSNRTLNELLVRTRAAYLQGDNKGAMDAFNRSLKRAAIIRKALAPAPPAVLVGLLLAQARQGGAYICLDDLRSALSVFSCWRRKRQED
jgi:protein arginine kinase